MKYLPLICLLLLGCRNYSFTGADIPAGAETYSVEQFEIKAPLAGPVSGQVFTETLRDLLQAQTPLRYVTRSGNLQYSGAITGYDIQPVAIQSNESAALNRLTISVNIEFINSIEEKNNKDFSISRFSDYSSDKDISAVEAELLEDICSQLAQDVFDRTLGNW